VFELDLDRRRADGAAAAISARLLTTPEADCGPTGGTGADDMLCGGGVWAPSGPTLVPRGDDYGFWRRGNVEIVCARHAIPLAGDWPSFVAAVLRALDQNAVRSTAAPSHSQM